jgi:hypothetical protein
MFTSRIAAAACPVVESITYELIESSDSNRQFPSDAAFPLIRCRCPRMSTTAVFGDQFRVINCGFLSESPDFKFCVNRFLSKSHDNVRETLHETGYKTLILRATGLDRELVLQSYSSTSKHSERGRHPCHHPFAS